MFDRVGDVEGGGVVGIGVDADEAEALGRVELEVVNLLHGDFGGSVEAVVFVGRATGPSAGERDGLARDQVPGGKVLTDVGIDGPHPVILAGLFRHGGREGGSDGAIAERAGDDEVRSAFDGRDHDVRTRGDVGHGRRLGEQCAALQLAAPLARRRLSLNVDGPVQRMNGDLFLAGMQAVFG